MITLVVWIAAKVVVVATAATPQFQKEFHPSLALSGLGVVGMVGFRANIGGRSSPGPDPESFRGNSAVGKNDCVVGMLGPVIEHAVRRYCHYVATSAVGVQDDGRGGMLLQEASDLPTEIQFWIVVESIFFQEVVLFDAVVKCELFESFRNNGRRRARGQQPGRSFPENPPIFPFHDLGNGFGFHEEKPEAFGGSRQKYEILDSADSCYGFSDVNEDFVRQHGKFGFHLVVDVTVGSASLDSFRDAQFLLQLLY